MQTNRIISIVRSWRYCGDTPAHGKFLTAQAQDICAADYGNEVRVFFDRNPCYEEKPLKPYQFRQEITLRA